MELRSINDLGSYYFAYLIGNLEKNKSVLIRKWNRASGINGLNAAEVEMFFDEFIAALRKASRDLGDVDNFLDNFQPFRRINSRQIYEVLIDFLALQNRQTKDHLVRTACYALLTADFLGCDEDFILKINDASPFHDIGKIAIPEDIVLKKGKLTVTEADIIKFHAPIGAAMLRFLGFDTFAITSTLLHHERFDQQGYFGIPIDELPVCASIVKLADVYDALMSERPYKPAFTHEKTTAIILGSKGEFFPEILEVFANNHDKYREVSNDIIDVIS